MRRALLARFTLSASVALVVGCESSRPLEPTAGPSLARKPVAEPGFATLSTLPSLGRGGNANAEAYAVQQ